MFALSGYERKVIKSIQYLSLDKEIDFDTGNMAKMIDRAESKKKLLRTLILVYSQLDELGKVVVVLSNDENNFYKFESVAVLAWMLQYWDVEFGENYISFAP
mgnify:CR=1 FL=1